MILAPPTFMFITQHQVSGQQEYQILQQAKHHQTLRLPMLAFFLNQSQTQLQSFLVYKLLELHRLRIGSYRAIYQVNNDQMEILILFAGSRGDIYKWLSKY